MEAPTMPTRNRTESETHTTKKKTTTTTTTSPSSPRLTTTVTIGSSLTGDPRVGESYLYPPHLYIDLDASKVKDVQSADGPRSPATLIHVVPSQRNESLPDENRDSEDHYSRRPSDYTINDADDICGSYDSIDVEAARGRNGEYFNHRDFMEPIRVTDEQPSPCSLLNTSGSLTPKGRGGDDPNTAQESRGKGCTGTPDDLGQSCGTNRGATITRRHKQQDNVGKYIDTDTSILLDGDHMNDQNPQVRGLVNDLSIKEVMPVAENLDITQSPNHSILTGRRREQEEPIFKTRAYISAIEDESRHPWNHGDLVINSRSSPQKSKQTLDIENGPVPSQGAGCSRKKETLNNWAFPANFSTPQPERRLSRGQNEDEYESMHSSRSQVPESFPFLQHVQRKYRRAKSDSVYIHRHNSNLQLSPTSKKRNSLRKQTIDPIPLQRADELPQPKDDLTSTDIKHIANLEQPPQSAEIKDSKIHNTGIQYSDSRLGSKSESESSGEAGGSAEKEIPEAQSSVIADDQSPSHGVPDRRHHSLPFSLFPGQRRSVSHTSSFPLAMLRFDDGYLDVLDSSSHPRSQTNEGQGKREESSNSDSKKHNNASRQIGHCRTERSLANKQGSAISALVLCSYSNFSGNESCLQLLESPSPKYEKRSLNALNTKASATHDATNNIDDSDTRKTHTEDQHRPDSKTDSAADMRMSDCDSPRVMMAMTGGAHTHTHDNHFLENAQICAQEAHSGDYILPTQTFFKADHTNRKSLPSSLTLLGLQTPMQIGSDCASANAIETYEQASLTSTHSRSKGTADASSVPEYSKTSPQRQHSPGLTAVHRRGFPLDNLCVMTEDYGPSHANLSEQQRTVPEDIPGNYGDLQVGTNSLDENAGGVSKDNVAKSRHTKTKHSSGTKCSPAVRKRKTICTVPKKSIKSQTSFPEYLSRSSLPPSSKRTSCPTSSLKNVWNNLFNIDYPLTPVTILQSKPGDTDRLAFQHAVHPNNASWGTMSTRVSNKSNIPSQRLSVFSRHMNANPTGFILGARRLDLEY